jgi:hypothetical protein
MVIGSIEDLLETLDIIEDQKLQVYNSSSGPYGRCAYG